MTTAFSGASARNGFVVGFALGIGVAVAAMSLHERDIAPRLADPSVVGETDPANAPWHRGAMQGSLVSAVEASARLLPASPARRDAAHVPQAADAGVEDLIARAEVRRRNREFQQACELYAMAVARGSMTADAWADYADAQAALGGRLAGAPARAIEAALELDPRHPKALWLQASLEHEERRYGDALATWRRLLAVVPPGSSDARIVEANIAEAERLARG